MDNFTEDELSRFHFIDDQHPADFSLIQGRLSGKQVAVLCWIDTENEMLRPMAILLNDGHMESIEFEGMEITKG